MKSFRVFLNVIKIEHALFTLPFAYLGMLLGARGWPPAESGWPGWMEIFWVTVAMGGARTAAMSFNRYIDRYIDAWNPRTADRDIPTGRISANKVLFYGLLSLAVLLVAAWMLNFLAFILAPPAIIFLVGYSYAKRFTWLSHWILGATDALAVAGGWIAVTASIDPPTWVLWLAVMTWVAGFDIIYGCQDVEFDRAYGFHSFPARFGVPASLQLARFMHILTVIALAGAGWMMELSWPYWLGLGISIGLFIYEHSLISPTDLSKLDFAFFNINGYIAIIIFVGSLGALWL